ncbi:MAG TPA: U32 family peptidase [Bacilli bacterium]|nr:U32 family peptidase [Bacilli bacterium]
MEKNKIELLAPADTLEKVKWAFYYGADAVYLGGQDYSLRANAENLSVKEIKEACSYAHKLNKKIYVTVNIVFHNEDIKGLEQYIKELNDAKVDAIILSDPLVIDIAKKVAPNLNLFLSTQQNTLNYEACNYWYNEGIKRVILGREASKENIESIIKNSKMNIEIFVQGAMCVGYSGRCMLSNYFTNRDSNRGGCSQICRWNFDLYNKNKKKIKSKQRFSMAVKDLTLLPHIPELIDMGIVSLKVEGRMRSIYYIATIINVYRKVIDEYYETGKVEELNKYEKELVRCANRESAVQYFIKKPGVNEQYYSNDDLSSNKDFLGVVLDYDKKNKEIILEQRNYFKVGDIINIFGPGIKDFDVKVEYIKNANGIIDIARHPKEIIRIPCNIEVKKDYILRVKF